MRTKAFWALETDGTCVSLIDLIRYAGGEMVSSHAPWLCTTCTCRQIVE